MGHQRIGRLPRTHHWQHLLNLLADEPQETARIAAAAIRAAETRLGQQADERAVPECYWLLVRLTAAARGGDFAGDAAALGTPVMPGESVVGFIARVSQDLSDSLRSSPGAASYTELAVHSLRSTLMRTVGTQGKGLFGTPVDDLQHTFHEYGTAKGFGRLAHHFFGDFTARALRYFLDREIGNHIDPAYGLTTVDDAPGFSEALETHARETSRIVEEFACDWYSVRVRRDEGQISRDEVMVESQAA